MSVIVKGFCLAASALTFAGIVAATPAVANASTSGPTATVTATSVNVREAPTPNSPSVVAIKRGFTFDIRCQAPGASVGGSRTWYAIGPDVGKWVPASAVRSHGRVPQCGAGVSAPATTAGDPVLNSFRGPTIQDGSLNEYQPGSTVRIRCEVTNVSDTASTTWYLTTRGDWLPGSYVTLRRGAHVEIC